MKVTKYISLGILVILLTSTIGLVAQYTGKTITTIQGSGALPATCKVGDTAFKTDATAGSNWYGCASTNIWTLLGAPPPTGGFFQSTYAALPACNVSTTGAVYLVTTSPLMMQCNGSTWLGIWKGTVNGTVFNLTDWPQSGGTATVSDTTGGITVTGANNTSADFTRTITPVRPYRIWACADYPYRKEDPGSVGFFMCLKDTVNNTDVCIGDFWIGGRFISVWHDNPGFGFTIQRPISAQPFGPERGLECYGIRETSITRFYEISFNAKTWFTWYSEPVGTYVTTVPNKSLVSSGGASANYPPSGRLGVWSLDAL